MILTVDDRVQETSNTTGTGPISLAGATLQYQKFGASKIGYGNPTIYCAESGDSTNWEVGISLGVTAGPPDIITRDIIWESTNSNLPISLSGTSLIFCPMGIGLTLGALTLLVIVAGEAISACEFINVYDDSGTAKIRKAIASDPAKFASGFSPLAISNGDPGIVLFFGRNAAVGGSVSTPASQVWLSDSVGGGFQTTAPTTAGHIVQSLGPAIPGVGIIFHPSPTVEL
jgi:hypothetical protein